MNIEIKRNVNIVLNEEEQRIIKSAHEIIENLCYCIEDDDIITINGTEYDMDFLCDMKILLGDIQANNNTPIIVKGEK